MSRLNRKLQRMGRRRFLSTVGALGASASAVAGMSQSVMAELIDDSKREVPRLYGYVHTNHEAVKEDGASPERAPVYYKISRDQWRRVEAAHQARTEIAEQLADLPQPASAFVTTNSNGEKQIDVDVVDDGSLTRRNIHQIEDQLPTSVDGVAGVGTDMEETVRAIPVAVNRFKTSNEPPRPLGNHPDYYWKTGTRSLLVPQADSDTP